MIDKSGVSFRIAIPYLIGLSLVIIFFIFYNKNSRDVGELDIEYVIDRQSAFTEDTPSLFLSGINQDVFDYKYRFLKRLRAKTVILGSSRATQIRHQFFNGTYYNLGGAIGNVIDLEKYAFSVQSLDRGPTYTVVMIDPWWFNGKSARGLGTPQSDFPLNASLDHLLASIKLFLKGNWLVESSKSKNLGIYSILTGDGYASDGSYHYVQAGRGIYSNADIMFNDTKNRIINNKFPFEKSAVPEPFFLKRLCNALKIIKNNTNVILVAPPFENSIWKMMDLSGEYNYIRSGYDALESCVEEKIYTFFSGNDINGSNECEFIDGYHGGEITYGRIFLELAKRDSKFKSVINSQYLETFVKKHAGSALGLTTDLFLNGKEADFLQIDCKKLQSINL